ncbi:MAG TPA: (Fe-S)-binding protein [Conexibacter sp.]|nr:(Fe-S)-binding protein [Conexibacter sp.]
MRVALFVTCLNDTLFPATGRAVVTLLERLGHEVAFPLEQTCCGQMHVNSGYPQEALPLVRRFVRVFAEEELVVAPSGSCVAMVREHYPRLARELGDEELAARAQQLGGRVLELSELLVDRLGLEDVGARYPHRVTYHASCHGLRALGVRDQPLRLLRAVRELELVELPDAEQCCGFGGTFAIKNADTSIAMLEDKLRAVDATGAQVCTAGDNSCLMHVGGALARRGDRAARAVHLAEILAAT